MLRFFQFIAAERLDRLEGLTLALGASGGRALLGHGGHLRLPRLSRKFESRYHHVVRPGQSRCDLDNVCRSRFRRRRVRCVDRGIAGHVSPQGRLPPGERRRRLRCDRVFRSSLRLPGHGFPKHLGRGLARRGFIGARRFGNHLCRVLATAAGRLSLVLRQVRRFEQLQTRGV